MRATQAVTLAAYNRWMNERLYEVCAGLSDAQRRADRGAFFGSIHGTLNHLLLGDRLWLASFAGEHFETSGLNRELYSDFDELRRQRAKTDEDLVAWAGSLTDEKLMEPFEFTSFGNPRPRRCELWVPVTHLFNHQTHHRGQLTTLLSQAGQDYGTTDIIFLPGLLEDL